MGQKADLLEDQKVDPLEGLLEGLEDQMVDRLDLLEALEDQMVELEGQMEALEDLLEVLVGLLVAEGPLLPNQSLGHGPIEGLRFSMAVREEHLLQDSDLG